MPSAIFNPGQQVSASVASSVWPSMWHWLLEPQQRPRQQANGLASRAFLLPEPQPAFCGCCRTCDPFGDGGAIKGSGRCGERRCDELGADMVQNPTSITLCKPCRSGVTTGTIIIAEVVLVHLLHEVTSKSPHSGKTIVDVNKLRPMSRCTFLTIENCQKLYERHGPSACKDEVFWHLALRRTASAKCATRRVTPSCRDKHQA